MSEFTPINVNCPEPSNVFGTSAPLSCWADTAVERMLKNPEGRLVMAVKESSAMGDGPWRAWFANDDREMTE